MLNIDETLLQFQTIRLELLTQHHVNHLITAASDDRIWTSQHVAYHQPELFKKGWLNKAFISMQTQQRYVVVIFLQDTIIGSSSFYDIDIDHKKMKVGYTWYNPQYWGQGINPIVKYLMLKYAFEILKFNRVSFAVDSENTRSRRALEKLNIPFEGVLRNHMLRADGTQRHTAAYAVTIEDWPRIKKIIL